MKNWLAGVLSLGVAAALFAPTVFVIGKSSYREREEDGSSLSVYSNLSNLTPRISLDLDEVTETRAKGSLFVLFPFRNLPPDLTWMVIANDALAFRVHPDSQSKVAGQVDRAKGIDSCDGVETMAPWAADAVLVGKGDQAWIPGMTEKTGINGGGDASETGFHFDVSFDRDAVRADDVGKYIYELGRFNSADTSGSGSCRVAPGLGEVSSVPIVSTVTIRGDGQTDPVLYANPAATGRGKVQWVSPDPGTTLTVTFESEDAKRRNALLLFLSGIFVGLSGGFFVAATQRSSFSE